MVAVVVNLIGEAVMFDSPKQRKSIDVVLESPRKFIPFESVEKNWSKNKRKDTT